MKIPFIGPPHSVNIGRDLIDWVKHTRHLAVIIDERLSWLKHLIDARNCFVNKRKPVSTFSSDVLIGRIGTKKAISRTANVMVPYETPIIVEQDAVNFDVISQHGNGKAQ